LIFHTDANVGGLLDTLHNNMKGKVDEIISSLPWLDIVRRKQQHQTGMNLQYFHSHSLWLIVLYL